MVLPFRAVVLLLLCVPIAGCVGPQAPAEVEPTAAAAGVLPLDAALAPVFSPLTVIDDLRSGGEPSIAVTPTGTLIVAAHPGFTLHRKPAGPELVAPYAGQSYMWRSTDGGETWTYVGLPVVNAGPRNAGPGFGDPNLDVGPDGTVYFTDLSGLAQITVAKSTDDGATWLHANPVSSPFPFVDRQWLASYGNDVYLEAQQAGLGARFFAKADAATLLFRYVSQPPGRGPPGDMSADQRDGTIYIGDGGEFHRSTDGGATWETRGPGPADSGSSEPGIDAAGNVYVAWASGKKVRFAATTDKGETFLPTIDLTALAPELADGAAVLWPWVVAGDEGRVAVVWLAAPDDKDRATAAGDWFLYGAYLLDAHTGEPRVTVQRLAADPVHRGPVCNEGTIQCVGSPTSDRRMGDMFEAALGPDGRLHVAVPVTTGGGSVSHPAHVRQLAGVSLLETVGVLNG